MSPWEAERRRASGGVAGAPASTQLPGAAGPRRAGGDGVFLDTLSAVVVSC